MDSLQGNTYIGPAAPADFDWSLLPPELGMLLQMSNGLIALHGGLHVRGVGDVPEWHDLFAVWKGEHALHLVYPDVEETDVPFAQDCFGDQFLLRDGVVMKLATEVGHVEQIAEDLGAFLAAVVDDGMEYLDLELLKMFRDDGEELEPGFLLQVDPPFSSEEAEDGVTLEPVPAGERLEFLFSYFRVMSQG